MTLGELKALVANFEAADDNIEIVTADSETGRLVNLDLHGTAIIGRDSKNKLCMLSDANEKVLLCYVSLD